MKYSSLILTLTLLAIGFNPSFSQAPYKLGVQENVQGSSNSSAYPAPQMMQPQVQIAPAKPPKRKPISGKAAKSSNQINGNASQQNFSAGVTAVALPPAFLGSWQVHGQRTAVDALPEFQAAAQQAFSISNDQIWNISGQQGSYILGSNTGISTALVVDKVQGNTAFVRYQHPVGNTMAQEAIVMSLRPGGAQFDGLERISIVKQGLPQPRAKVTYQLTGFRH